MKKALTVTISTQWILHVEFFDNYTDGTGSWATERIRVNLKPETIHKKVLEMENKQRSRHDGKNHRQVALNYWVTEEEVIVDNRSKFGHHKCASSKLLRRIIETTYVRGEKMTIREALEQGEKHLISPHTKATLRNVIGLDFKFDIDNLTDEQLDTMVVIIPGELMRKSFFKPLYEGEQVKTFSEDQLLPFKEGAA